MLLLFIADAFLTGYLTIFNIARYTKNTVLISGIIIVLYHLTTH